MLFPAGIDRPALFPWLARLRRLVDDIAWVASLAVCGLNLGVQLAAVGRFGDAREMYRLGEDIMAGLAQAQPDEPQWQQILAHIKSNIAQLPRR